MNKPISKKILCIPGIGHSLAEDNWFDIWKSKFLEFVESDGYVKDDENQLSLEFIPFRYRNELKNTIIDPGGFADALAELAFGLPPEILGHLFRQSDGISPIEEALKWRAASIIQWATHDELRTDLSADLQETLIREQPDVILAFSLGSLIAYDALKSMSKPFLEQRYLITFGSQLGSPYVRNIFAGRINGLPVKRWYNLFNPHDTVFTTSLYLQEENYTQVIVDFDNPDPLDHTAVSTGEGTTGYIDHYASRQLVWPVVLAKDTPSPFLKSVRRSLHSGNPFNNPDHRALLIGIDQYEQPHIPNLFGSVNDTYLISQTLQTAGFPAQNIRMLHNHRADKQSILDRISWLLDDMEKGELRLLHFSGHGGQLESYGVGETVDRLDECLCPYNFNWSVDTSIMDDTLCEMYSQLHYDSNLMIILDCCHSGGMARNGQSVRGLAAPGDVAHRGLFYKAQSTLKSKMNFNYGAWRRKAMIENEDLPDSYKYAAEQRPFVINPDFYGKNALYDQSEYVAWFGSLGTIRKIGRSPSLRRLEAAKYDSIRDELKHYGPYLPVILEACMENEPALEHTQGSVTHGAFTFALCQSLRQHFRMGEELDLNQLKADCSEIMSELGYTQTPVILCNKTKARIKIPA